MRARQTAEIISNIVRIPMDEMSEFVERHFGDAEGMTVQERTTTFPDKKYINVEEWEDLISRVTIGLEKITQNYKSKRVIVVVHGAVINAILAELSNGEVGSGKTRLVNACINNIAFSEGKWNIKDFNQVTHLSQFR